MGSETSTVSGGLAPPKHQSTIFCLYPSTGSTPGRSSIRPSALVALAPMTMNPPKVLANDESFLRVSSLFGASDLNSKRAFSTAPSCSNSCRSPGVSSDNGLAKIDIRIYVKQTAFFNLCPERASQRVWFSSQSGGRLFDGKN